MNQISKSIVFAALTGFFAHSHGKGEELSLSFDKLTESWRKAQEGLCIESTNEGLLTDKIKFKPPGDRFVTAIDYTVGLNKYHYKVVHTNVAGIKTVDAEYAHNGQNYFILLNKDSMLEVSKIPLKNNAILGNLNTIFRPYFFMNKLLDDTFNPNRVISAADLSNLDYWKKLSGQLDKVLGDKNNYVLLEIKNPAIPNHSFEVIFSKKENSLPVNWKYFIDGKVRFEYAITQIGSAKTEDKQVVYYPKTATEWAYGINGNIGTVINHAIAKFEIKKLDEEAFEIDPAKAQSVYDVENKSLIKIPQ